MGINKQKAAERIEALEAKAKKEKEAKDLRFYPPEFTEHDYLEMKERIYRKWEE